MLPGGRSHGVPPINCVSFGISREVLDVRAQRRTAPIPLKVPRAPASLADLRPCSVADVLFVADLCRSGSDSVETRSEGLGWDGVLSAVIDDITAVSMVVRADTPICQLG